MIWNINTVIMNLNCLQRLKNFRKKKVSQKKTAETIGITDGTLSQLRNGKYNANPQKLFDIIESYFGVKEAAKLTYSEVGYAQTSISSEIYNIIRVCQVKGGLAIACGAAGIGKTKAAQQFVKEHKTNSVLITVNPCISSIKSLLKVVAGKVGAAIKKTRDELWLSIIESLSDGMVLIFDEAQHLPPTTIEVLRSFRIILQIMDKPLGYVLWEILKRLTDTAVKGPNLHRLPTVPSRKRFIHRKKLNETIL